jgi:hypothetical protein
MKTILIAFIFLITATSLFSQKNYEKGYFIGNDNHRTECLIKNYDRRNNPRAFIYKLNVKDQPQKGDTASVREFGVYGYFKFIRAKVKIDRSGYRIGELTTDREPVWSDELLFLRVLAEGNASLYSFEDDDVCRFFYSVLDSSVHQLVQKKYLIEKDKVGSNDIFGYNNQFRQQLWMEVRCTNLSMRSMEKIEYTQNSLVKYFETYNNSTGNQTIKYSDNSKKEIFNLRLTPGIDISSLQLPNPVTGIDILSVENNVSFRLGMECEFKLLFHKNKWSIIFEPTFQYFRSEEGSNNYPTTIAFNSIDFPVGLRRYFSINEHSRLFMNAFYISKLSVNFNSMIHNSSYPISEISTGASFSVGGGIDYKRTSLEVRYYTNRDLLASYSFWDTNYTRFSVIFGYRFLKK